MEPKLPLGGMGANRRHGHRALWDRSHPENLAARPRLLFHTNGGGEPQANRSRQPWGTSMQPINRCCNLSELVDLPQLDGRESRGFTEHVYRKPHAGQPFNR